MKLEPTVGLSALLLLLISSEATAQSFKLGGSVRGYQFFSLEDPLLIDRRDSEIWFVRLTDETDFGGVVNLEVHTLFSATSPPVSQTSLIAYRGSRKFLPLQWDLVDCDNLNVGFGFDRLNLQFDFNKVRITVGRQAITWGVSYFWPALDLFAPFAPQQIDREYKAGVDAARVVVALGHFSELEIIGGVLGTSTERDGSVGALLRWNVGSADVGFMGGRFHQDNVLGTFVTADVRGTGLRAELSWTDSGDPSDLALQRERFWRGSMGLDRQLTSRLNLTMETAWNGYGTCDPSQYLALIQAERYSRGEVTGLGRIYAGAALTWIIQPVLTVANSLLVNLSDASVLWVPTLQWSASDSLDVVAGGQVGLGPELSFEGEVESEYGLVPVSIFGSVRIYF